jgi:hypothetical protein
MPYFKVFDRWNRIIIAYDETWKHAISGHRELVSKENFVMQSLIDPEFLYQSDTDSNTRLYVGPAIVNGIYGGETPVSVVEYRGTAQGVWTTGYFGTVSPSLKLLWNK